MIKDKNNWNKLTAEEQRVILHKGTEYAFSGEYNDFKGVEGVFVCRQCEAPLYEVNTKFDSGCGWPSFDDASDFVERVPDADGRRIEIVCKNCKGHLGHVFEGERLTEKNTRHCVNSVSIKYKKN